VTGEDQVISSGSWAYDKFYPFANQNADGSQPTINSVSGGTDGALVEDTDYYIVKNEDGRWGIIITDSTDVTTEDQDITVNMDYTPAESYQLDMGEKSASLTRKIVEFSKTQDGKVFRARLWAASNEEGIQFTFPDSAGDEPSSVPITLAGGLDTDRATGKQLIEVYDEIGVTV
jgi:hypothetical protein